MHATNELSQAVRTRRSDIGLSQTALAELSGLSLSDVERVETGTIKDLSLTRTAALLDILGLSLTISPAHPRLSLETSSSTPLEIASRTASVSYASSIRSEVLSDALSTGEIQAEFIPHITTLLEEAPISLLAKAVEQVHLQRSVPRVQIWTNMRLLAAKFKTSRKFWTPAC
jgi:transcriptional regulator with XRE-family HTH domain